MLEGAVIEKTILLVESKRRKLWGDVFLKKIADQFIAEKIILARVLPSAPESRCSTPFPVLDT